MQIRHQRARTGNVLSHEMKIKSFKIRDLLSHPALRAEWKGEPERTEIEFRSVCTDTRVMVKDALFFALRGERFDAHRFLTADIADKVTALVVNRSWYESNKQNFNSGTPFLVVDDTLPALQEMARQYRLGFDIPVVAITGSSGKTTAKEMIAHVLSQHFTVHKNIKSFNNHVGVPLTLFGLEPEHEILVTELGTNHFGELKRLSYLVQPTVCVILNIGYAHLEFFNSLEGVAKAKMEIFAFAADDGTAIYNCDDPILSKQHFPLKHKLCFGTREQAEVSALIQECDVFAQYTFLFDNRAIKLGIPGRHNVENALAATAVAKHFSVASESIQNRLQSFEAVDKRMQVEWYDDIAILNDAYNSNPNSLKAALLTLNDMHVQCSSRRLAVLGDMLELGDFSRAEHEKLVDLAKALDIHSLFLYGDSMRRAKSRAEEIGYTGVCHFDSKKALAEELYNAIQPGDIVLVKGSRGLRMETIIEALKNKMFL